MTPTDPNFDNALDYISNAVQWLQDVMSVFAVLLEAAEHLVRALDSSDKAIE